MVKIPRIIYHKIKLSMTLGSTLQSSPTTSYDLHSLEPTKALFEWNNKRTGEETNNMTTIMQINFQKMKPNLWEKINLVNKIVTIPFSNSFLHNHIASYVWRNMHS